MTPTTSGETQMTARDLLRELLELCIDHRYAIPGNLRARIDAFLAEPNTAPHVCQGAWHKISGENFMGQEWRCHCEAKHPIDCPITLAAPASLEEREGWKLLKDSTFDERSFHEDAPLENGCYYHDCARCGKSFIGYKRRVICKVCEAARALSGKTEGKG